MNNKLLTAATLSLMAVATTAQADLSTTVNVTSDYTFNGVSQTDSSPALQASLDYANESGLYVGTWASNLDFGASDDTNIEWDFYIGKGYTLTENVSVDLGLAYYTYHGENFSDNYNYAEVYSKFGFSNELGQSEVNFWYANDYAGSKAGHWIVMLGHTFTIAQGHDVRVSADRSTSLDEEKWAWGDSSSYNHYRVEYNTSYQGFNINLAAETTNLDWDSADERVVLSVSRSFGL